MNMYDRYEDADLRVMIAAYLTPRDMLEQMAEEASELAQACIKVVRASGETRNMTPVSRAEAFRKLYAEVTDVITVWNVLNKYIAEYEDIGTVAEILGTYQPERERLERWAKRIGVPEDERTNA